MAKLKLGFRFFGTACIWAQTQFHTDYIKLHFICKLLLILECPEQTEAAQWRVEDKCIWQAEQYVLPPAVDVSSVVYSSRQKRVTYEKATVAPTLFHDDDWCDVAKSVLTRHIFQINGGGSTLGQGGARARAP